MAGTNSVFFGKLIALGPLRGTAAVTAGCAAASLAISFSVMAALGRVTLQGIAISVVVPLLLVPVSWYPFIRVSSLLHAAEARLRASEEKHRTILASMREAYLEIDAGGRIAFFNDALCRISGYPAAEIAGRPAADFIPPAALLRLRRAALRQMRRGRGELDEVAIRARDGSTRFLEASLAPLPESGGVRAVARDITERRAAAREREAYEERLQRARKMESLGLLAGGVAHDLNNVLSGLVGYPDILLHDYPDDPALRAGLTTIRESGERAAAIVQDLLALSRRGVSALEPLDLNRVVGELLRSAELARLLRDHPQVLLHDGLSPGLRAIEGSPVHLTKALANVLRNACEAIPGAGTVSVATENRRIDRPRRGFENIPPGDYVAVEVSDTGGGISTRDLDRIFEPFYTRKVLGRSGTGLGLAVVWGVVKDHRGYVDVYSTAAGTTIELLFPASGREIPAPAAAEDPPPPPGSGERALVVDDESDQREIAVQMLSRLGFRAGSAAGPAEAMERLRGEPVALVVLDMLMGPGPDGLDAALAIRAARPGLPIVIASGYAETDRVRAALDLGRVAFLRKPFRMETLGRAARAVMEEPAGGAPAAG